MAGWFTWWREDTRRLEGGHDRAALHGGNSAESSALFLTRPDVSAWLTWVIGREGEVFQLVHFATGKIMVRRAWRVEPLLDRLSWITSGKHSGSLGMFIAECGRVVPPEEFTRTVLVIARRTGHCYKERSRSKREVCVCWKRIYLIVTWGSLSDHAGERSTRVRRWNSPLAISR